MVLFGMHLFNFLCSMTVNLPAADFLSGLQMIGAVVATVWAPVRPTADDLLLPMNSQKLRVTSPSCFVTEYLMQIQLHLGNALLESLSPFRGKLYDFL